MDIKEINADVAMNYSKLITDCLYESVKLSNYEEQYSYGEAQEKFQELIDYLKNDKAVLFGAFGESDNLQGIVWAYEYPFREDTNRLYISVFHVVEMYRSQGIGEKLIREVENYAKNRGFSAVYLHAEATNDGACRFYEKMNYKKERIQYVRHCLNEESSYVTDNMRGVLKY